jgi:hypothetical protein
MHIQLTLPGTGMAARQRQKVQGRIENGTLFPNISFTLKTHMNKLAEKTLDEAEEHFDGVLAFIQSDLEMILDAESDPMNIEEEIALEQFSGVLEVLQARHDEILARIS